MKFTLNKKTETEIDISVVVDVADQEKYLARAAQEVSTPQHFPGFRAGKVPYEMVKQKFGEQTLLEMALEPMLTMYYAEIIKKENLVTIGSPKVSITKVVAGNPVEVVFTVMLIPKIKIGDYKKIGVKKKEISIDTKKVQEKLTSIQKERAQEVSKDGGAEKGDIIYINYQIKKNNVPVEQGHGHEMPVELGNSHLIPGFEEHLFGLKKDDEKSFEITFPEKYHSKELAGQKVIFEIKVTGVFSLSLPELTDENAKKLFGADTIADLKSKIEKQLITEQERSQRQKDETDFFDALIEKSKFDPIPEEMIKRESEKILQEFADMLRSNGLTMDDYLLQVDKKDEEVKKDFSVQAEKRIKVSLLIQEIAKTENISIDDKEIEERISRQRAMYEMMLARANQDTSHEATHARAEVEQFLTLSNTPEYRRYLKNEILSDKTVTWIGKELLGY